MIIIKRTECPTSLDKHNNEFVENDYKKGDVIVALLDMQYRKCCYCEKSLKDNERTENEVEHFIPRNALKDEYGSVQWHLANMWENLLFSCRTCNSRKGIKPPFNATTKKQEIINPSCEDIDPEKHIDFVLDTAVYISFKPKDNSNLGRLTIERLKLNTRRDLVRHFRQLKHEIESEFIYLTNAVESDNNMAIDEHKQALVRVMSADKPFAAFSRKYIGERLRKFNEEDLPILERKYNRSFDRITISFLKGNDIVH